MNQRGSILFIDWFKIHCTPHRTTEKSKGISLDEWRVGEYNNKRVSEEPLFLWLRLDQSIAVVFHVPIYEGTAVGLAQLICNFQPSSLNGCKSEYATVAQLVEQLIRNALVINH